MKKKADFIVLGRGIGALSYLFELSRSYSPLQKKKILVISAQNLAPTCSSNTTSTVSLTGIQTGVSPLGDILFHSYEHFKNIIYPEFKDSNTIEKVTKKHFFINDLEKAKKRFQNVSNLCDPYLKTAMPGVLEADSFLIYPNQYQLVLEKKIQEKLDIEFADDFILDIKTTDRFTLISKGAEYHCEFLLDARGAYQKVFENFSHQKINEKVVEGCFLEINIKLNCASFYYVFDELNLLYRSITQELIIGSSSFEGNQMIANLATLSEKYNRLKDYLNLDLPPFESFQFKSGLRSKGPKRMPKLVTKENYYRMSGLYKNAYSTAMYLSWQHLQAEIC